jgi:outer membrane protein TolC
VTGSETGRLRLWVLVTVLWAGLAVAGAAQAANGLDALVEEGLAANRGLHAERLALEREQAAVTEATGLFLPSLALSGRISDRTGNIFDLGRLINPAYAALDQLTHSTAFPTDIDLKLPTREEGVLRLTQPLLDARLPANWRIHAGLRDAQRAATGAATRRLAADLRAGYLDYARAVRLTQLFDSTLVLVQEVVRVQESLLANGAATPDEVLRARADRSEIEQRRADAARLADAARQSFNQRLGRDVNAPLAPLPDSTLGIAAPPPLESALASALADREELAQARGGVRAAGGALSLASARYLPSLAAAVDWGVQGEHVRRGDGSDYRIASLVAQWPIFDGGQREAQRHEAAAQLAAARERAADAATLVELDVRTAWQAAEVARLSRVTAGDRLAAAKRTWEMVERRRANGSASLLEVLDARTTYTSAGLNDVLTTCEYWQRCAELDRAAARYPDRSRVSGGR